MENVYDTDWDTTEDEPGYEWTRIRPGRRLGAEKLGASIYVLAPGQKSFPYHFHQANESNGNVQSDSGRRTGRIEAICP